MSNIELFKDDAAIILKHVEEDGKQKVKVEVMVPNYNDDDDISDASLVAYILGNKLSTQDGLQSVIDEFITRQEETKH